MFRMAKTVLLGLMFSTSAWADHDWDDYENYGYPYREEIIYEPPVVQYWAPPVVEYVEPPVYEYHYDRRSPQGLLGGLIGSALGYQLGEGDPLAAGLGAAAGAWLGNGAY